MASSCQNDERVWGRLCLRDYHNTSLSQLLAAKTLSNKKFYAGLKHARVFVWGSTDNGRLGIHLDSPLDRQAARYRRYIASPKELKIDGKAGRTWHQGLLDNLTRLAPGSGGGDASDDRVTLPMVEAMPKEELGSVVSLVAGLTSFAALTSTGKVVVWGA
jgi:SCF-associated factor 1